VKFWEFWTHLWGIFSQHLWEPCSHVSSCCESRKIAAPPM